MIREALRRTALAAGQTHPGRRLASFWMRNIPDLSFPGSVPRSMPPAFLDSVRTYDQKTGYFKRADGTLDGCPTEVEVCQLWHSLVVMTRATSILETGTYQGLSTCYLAAGLRDNGGGRIVTIDPWQIPHLWENTSLQQYIEWLPLTSPEAFPQVQNRQFDLLFIDSEHTYRTSMWELSNFEPLVRPGGYIVFHDSLFHDGVGHTVCTLYDDPRFEPITFETPRRVVAPAITEPVPMGMTIVRKISNGATLRIDPTLVAVPEHPPYGPEPVARQYALNRAQKSAARTAAVTS